MQEDAAVKPAAPFRLKFIIAGLLIVAAVVVLVISSTQANAQYFLTVEELNQTRRLHGGQRYPHVRRSAGRFDFL